MPGKISILKDNGESLESNVVSVFTIPETEKKYVITTEYTVDPHGLTVLHVSELQDDTLARIATNEEWDSIKTIMRSVISGSVGSYTYLPTVESAKAAAQYTRDISVSSTAAKQMSDAYASGLQQLAGGAAPDANALPPQEDVGDVSLAVADASQPAAPSSIFPENSVVPTEENEVSPGIAEVGGDVNINSASVPVLAQTESAVPVDPSVGSPSVATASVEPVMPISVTPTMDPIPQPAPVAPAEVQPVTAEAQPVVAAPVEAQPAAQEVQPVAPVAEAPVQPVVPVEAVPVAPVAEVAVQPVAVAPVEPVQPVVPQVVAPVVPQAQIVQPVMQPVPEMPGISLNFNVPASFAPNATLDEVVSGSQELFMESVRNLVQTMTEKVYRDLYAKEAMLNEREALLNEREAMLNGQMMNVMNNYGQAPVATVPVQNQMVQQPMMQQVPMQPMMQPGVVPQAGMQQVPPMVGSVPVNPVANVNQAS